MKGLNEYMKLSKNLKSRGRKGLKIAFLSNFTINGLAETLRVMCDESGFSADAYTSAYNQYAQDIIERKSGLYSFDPDIIYMLLDAENLLGDFYFNPYSMDPAERKAYIEEKFGHVRGLLETLSGNVKAKVVINSIPTDVTTGRGILEGKAEWGLRACIRHFNQKLEAYSAGQSWLFVFDSDSFFSKYGADTVRDRKLSYLGDMKISPDGLVRMAHEYMAYIFPLMSATKKCIVLDLDNTLWGGIVGEDGLEGISLGPEKEGKPFMDFQKKILGLSERGVILAINSKNNYDDAMDVIRNHKHMILRENKFAAVRINWNDKSTNMKEIADEINIGLDSMVFMDDDDANCELVRSMLPEVTVIKMPDDSSQYPKVVDEMMFFNTFSITEDDLRRGAMYAEDRKRNALRSKSVDIESFIKQLGIEVSVLDVDGKTVPRVSQLTQKTNQFNLTTRRYLEEDIKRFIDSGSHAVRAIDVKDAFGEYGITGVAIVKKSASVWDVDSFLLSCRILGKRVEFALMESIIKDAKSSGAKMVNATFIRTGKNKPAEDFLKNCGFVLKSSEGVEMRYEFDVKKPFLVKSFCRVM